MIARESLNLQTPYELPAGKLEELIAGVFAEVFELDRIARPTNFSMSAAIRFSVKS